MVFLRDNVSLQKLKQQHKSADDDLVDDEHSALEFAITVGKNEGLDVQFVEKKTNKNNNNNDGEMEWWVTKCICRVENTGETIELKMEESATIAMLKMKLRTEMNKKAKKIYSSSSSFSIVIAFEEARKRYSRKEEREDEEGCLIVLVTFNEE